jgi:uncharacterized protein (DUF433 family)
VKDQPASVQRSFRLSPHTLELLDSAAEAAGVSRNALADRLLSEALRIDAHPQVRFHEGAGRRRQARLTSTRLYVYQIISTLKSNNGDLKATAEYFNLRPGQIEAALAYYADYQAEIDEWIERTHAIAEREEDAWRREQAILE